MGKMPDGCMAAQRASQAIDPTLQPNTLKERLAYFAFMRRDDIPVHSSPTAEIEWLAFALSVPSPSYDNAPSKVAGTWLRRLRLKGAERTKFWNEMWPYFMESRVGLELKASAPPTARKLARGTKSDEDVQGAIEKMGGHGQVS